MRLNFSIVLLLALVSTGIEDWRLQTAPAKASAMPRSPGGQDRIRIVTEEVQLSVAAYDNRGRFDPTLQLDDLLVLENGIPQQIRSLRRVPVSVILLLDTGGEINSAKRVQVTRAIAKDLVSALKPEDQVSVMQFNNKVELLQDWTNDSKAVIQTLETKMLSGKRACFSEAIAAAADRFRSVPRGNHQLVMITDGVETPGGKVTRTEAIKLLTSGDTVVHVISYTMVSRQAISKDQKVVRKRDKSTVPDEVVDSLPTDRGYDQLRQLHRPGGVIVDLDRERVGLIKEYEQAMRASELQLAALSNETGGRIWLPESFDEMIGDGAEAAHLIDAEYVITYRPKQPLASARAGEVRRIDVASRRVGLIVVSRRHYVVSAKH